MHRVRSIVFLCGMIAPSGLAASLEVSIRNAIEAEGLSPQSGSGRLGGEPFSLLAATGTVSAKNLITALRRRLAGQAVVEAFQSASSAFVVIRKPCNKDQIIASLNDAYVLSIMPLSTSLALTWLSPAAPILAMLSQIGPRPYTGDLLTTAREHLATELEAEFTFNGTVLKLMNGTLNISISSARDLLVRDLASHGLELDPRATTDTTLVFREARRVVRAELTVGSLSTTRIAINESRTTR